MTGITNEGLVLACSAIGAGLALPQPGPGDERAGLFPGAEGASGKIRRSYL